MFPIIIESKVMNTTDFNKGYYGTKNDGMINLKLDPICEKNLDLINFFSHVNQVNEVNENHFDEDNDITIYI